MFIMQLCSIYNSFSQANQHNIVPYYHMQERVFRSYFYWLKKKNTIYLHKLQESTNWITKVYNKNVLYSLYYI